jgi:DNA-directed RNA polymerase subunit RPC12/RpoP
MTFTDLFYYCLTALIILAIFGVFWAIAGFVIFRTVDRRLRRCPNCKRGAVGIIVDTETTPLGTHIDRSGKNPVQIKSEKVTDHFECKHCGHKWMRTYERKERYPIRDY